MTRLFYLSLLFCLSFTFVGCNAGGDATFEESDVATAEEEAADEEYAENLDSANDPSVMKGNSDPFAGSTSAPQ